LRDVNLRCTPLNPEAGEPVERTFATVPRGVFAIRNLDLPPAAGAGDFWAVELTYQFHHESNWEQDRTLFYVMAPGADCVRWAQTSQ
jgi:hypothetical protein